MNPTHDREAHMSPTDAEFLRWLKDRLIHVYGESPNMDFVQRLGRIVDAMTEQHHEEYARHQDRRNIRGRT
jgi:hypothetical protein